MKTLVLGLFVLAASLFCSARAQQILPCGGPPPMPPKMIDEGGGESTALKVWANAMASWVPCSGHGAGAGLISVRALRQKPIKAARKDFDKGMRAMHKGLRTEALEHFTEAARLDPSYVQALAQLGTLLAQGGQATLALESFLRAVAIEPDADYLQFDVAWTLLVLHQPAEAEVFARRAMQISPKSADTHYLLGLALVMQDKFTAETVGSLRLAGDENLQAREVLAWVQAQLSVERFSGR